MRGYLIDLSWESRLLELAREASLHERRSRLLSLQQRDLLISGEERYETRGGTWAVEENMFMRVYVNDLGQIQVNGVWPRVLLPTQAAEITLPFFNVLKSLDRDGDPGDLTKEMSE